VVEHLLAHVLVHEITHMVEGTNVHAETGIMKARWDRVDRLNMEAHPLAFTEEDVLLIHLGLARRVLRQTAAQLADGRVIRTP
jgi:hypothetical protein